MELKFYTYNIHYCCKSLIVAFIFLLLQVLAFSVDLAVDAQDVENAIDQVCYKIVDLFLVL